MGALTDDAEDCRVAGCFSLKLATLLCGHGVLVCKGDQCGDDERGEMGSLVWVVVVVVVVESK